MGICSSFCSQPDENAVMDGEDVASLIKTENITAEALGHQVVPPAPLLKEINFAAIADDASGEDGEDTDLDDDEVNELLEEEEETNEKD